MPGNRAATSGWKHRALLAGVLAVAMLSSGCLFNKKKTQPDLNSAAQPDKVLYDRATDDFKHGRYTVARLNLQTLINTYPDSEYLAKAKLAVADSYFKEGGTESLLQAIAEYNDFITLFPFLDEAAYAQMQVASTYYRLMEKSDRDRSDALNAEQEYQTFLLKYPHSPLVPVSEQKLREVQEVIADGEFRVADFYYVKGSYRAAAARLIDVTGRYPLYSQADRANWMLADIYEKHEKQDVANEYYARIVRDYPFSGFAAAAKKQLIANGASVPQPDPNALKLMQEEQTDAKNGPGMIQRTIHSPLVALRGAPDVSHAAHEGTPDMQPQGDVVSATQILRRGRPEPTYSNNAAPIAPQATSDNTGTVGEVSPGSGEGEGGGTGVAVEAVPDPGTGGTPAAESSSSSAQPSNDAPSAGGGGTPAEPQIGGGQSGTAPAGAPEGTAANSQAVSQAPTGSAPAAGTGSTPDSTAGQHADKLNKDAESTSKKKKGWHKLIPW